MEDDRIERQINFIIEQQAKFTVDIVGLKERMGEVSKQIGTLTQNVAVVSRDLAKLADVVLSLTGHVERHDEQLDRQDRHIEELAKQGKETDARLNALISVVDRLVPRPGTS